ncbi:hypothetical protein [Nodularia sp. UHCC 0506]|uniref:hypothetical protein n=1 Tax=Nodularia sp. UHCC 0506 TaxID=3110243 RepID=UPI002B214644|nr:hypothetical protein [Nodularia sp. UHCC 0506]MEA5512910.1 hypothetical protein [Nodularia sp. UHCC 0506]
MQPKTHTFDGTPCKNIAPTFGFISLKPSIYLGFIFIQQALNKFALQYSYRRTVKSQKSYPLGFAWILNSLLIYAMLY